MQGRRKGGLRGLQPPPNQKKREERGEEERKKEKGERGIKRERKLKLSFPEYVVMGL